jgi:hypothetical protein
MRSADRSISVTAAASGRPSSDVSVRPSSGARSRIRLAALFCKRARVAIGVLRHVLKARSAATIAMSASLLPPVGTVSTTAPVAGLTTLWRVPATACRQPPSMNISMRGL